MIRDCEKDNNCDQPATKKDIEDVYRLGLCIFVGVAALVFYATVSKR